MEAREHMDVDVAIIGAGISGLWLANRLLRRGLSVIVCSADAIGSGQTIASQGIIHSGLKYSLGKAAGPASKALATMPARWRACLAGKGEVDLRGTKVLADAMDLYATPQALPRALFAKALIAAGDPSAEAAHARERLETGAAKASRHGTWLALEDFVLDVPSLIRRLAEPLQDRFQTANVRPQMLVPAAAGIASIRAGGMEIRASAFVLAAGVGNEALGTAAGFKDVAMLKRPLHQTVVTLAQPVGLFAHCLTATFGTQPDMTITSHGDALYVGGKVASEPGLSDTQRLDAVRTGVSRHLPGIDLAGAELRVHRSVRAEPQREGRRGLWDDGDVFAERRGNCVLCWPVKLSLAPRLGDVVVDLLADLQPKPSVWRGTPASRPRYAEPPYLAVGAPAVA